MEGLFRDAGLAARLSELEIENSTLRAADAEHARRVAELEAANEELVHAALDNHQRVALENLQVPAGALVAASIAFGTIVEEEEEEEEEAEEVGPRAVHEKAPAARPREMPSSALRIDALAAAPAAAAAAPAPVVAAPAAAPAATPPSQASSAGAWFIAQTPARAPAPAVHSATVLKTPAWDNIWASTAKKPRAASEYLTPGAEALQQAIDFSHATLTGMRPRLSAAAPANESGCARGFGGRTPARPRFVLGALSLNGAATPLRA
jgi:hypothetical protein